MKRFPIITLIITLAIFLGGNHPAREPATYTLTLTEEEIREVTEGAYSPPASHHRSSPNPVSGLLALAGGIYTTAFIHEMGHYREAQASGLDPTIRLGLIKIAGPDGSSSLYFGYTEYAQQPRNHRRRAELALAGMASSRNFYETLDRDIKEGRTNGSFSSLLALMAKADFPRYALANALKNSADGADDIEAYAYYSGADKNFIYTAAACDLLFDWGDIAYHLRRAAGSHPSAPRESRIAGFRAEPRVFVRSDIGVAIGLGLSKRW